MNPWERNWDSAAPSPAAGPWARDWGAGAPAAPAEDLKKKLAEETSAGVAGVIGAGRIGDRMLEGLKQSGLGVGAIFSELLPERLKRAAQEEIAKRLMAQEKDQASKSKEYKNLEEAHPIATAVGESVPVVAAPMLRVASGAGAGAAALNAAASSALPAALEYGTAGERAGSAATAGLSGAVGSGIASGAAKVFGGVANVLTPEARRLAALAESKFNIPLDAADKTGNKALQTVNAALENMPVTSGAQATKNGVQRDALTREVMKTLGESTDEATTATWGAAKKRIGSDFERVFSKVHVNLDDTKVQANLAKVIQDSVDTLPEDSAAVVVKRASQLLDKIDDNGAVAGKAYQAWRSQVQQQAEKTSDQWLATQLRGLYRTVDEVAYKAAADVGEDGALKTARGQWKNLRTIEPLVAKSEDGRISPKLLREAVRAKTPDFAEGGGGDLAELAKIARQFVSDQVPNSGTAQRQLAQSLVTGGTMGGLGWAASGDPLTGAKMAAGTMVLPKAVQLALNSKAGQSLLMGGKALSPLEQALIDRAARLGVLGVANEGVQ